jgi:hypothetical protein
MPGDLGELAVNTRETSGEIAKLCSGVIARSASDEAIHTCSADAWIASLALAMPLKEFVLAV